MSTQTETRRGRGRPKSGNPRDRFANISLTQAELDRIKQAADSRGMSVAGFMRHESLTAATS